MSTELQNLRPQDVANMWLQQDGTPPRNARTDCSNQQHGNS